MLTIRNGYESIKKIAGNQQYSSNKCYRESYFCVKKECDDGILFFNTMTGELLLYSSSDWEKDDSMKEDLLSKWFLVPDSFDEIRHCDQIKKVAALLKPAPDHINNFVVFTTTDCNARCFYCFEMGQKRFSMTESTANDVAEYMLDVSKGKHISIRWFGGEPLFNSRVIDVISGKLLSAGADYSSTMVSNAYLFDDIMVSRAAALWNLKNVLITIDGTEQVYNKTKAFIYKDGSAFQKVLGNIEMLLQAGISVTVNTSMDKRNVTDLMELAVILGDRFRKYEKFAARAALLIEYVGKIDSFSSADEAIDSLKAVNKRLEACGICEHRLLTHNMKMNACMADNPKSVTILPDGRIGRCEHFGDSEEVGSIYSDVMDTERIDSWKQLKQPIPECRTCSHYPICYRLLKCNGSSAKCDLLERKFRDTELNYQIINTYKKWKEDSTDEN